MLTCKITDSRQNIVIENEVALLDISPSSNTRQFANRLLDLCDELDHNMHAEIAVALITLSRLVSTVDSLDFDIVSSLVHGSDKITPSEINDLKLFLRQL